MGLDAAEFAAEAKRVGKHRRCGVERVLSQLGVKDRAVLEEMLARDALDLSSGAIANVLGNHGFEASHNAVSTHRKGKCQCFRR